MIFQARKVSRAKHERFCQLSSVLPGSDGSDSWRDTLELAKKRNLLLDPDVRLHCMQIDGNDGLPVPGIVLEFSTVIVDGLNLFGKPLSPGDSYFSPSSFANKIHSVGIAFDGYKGISDPNTNSSGIDGAGGASPTTPPGGASTSINRPKLPESTSATGRSGA